MKSCSSGGGPSGSRAAMPTGAGHGGALRRRESPQPPSATLSLRRRTPLKGAAPAPPRTQDAPRAGRGGARGRPAGPGELRPRARAPARVGSAAAGSAGSAGSGLGPARASAGERPFPFAADRRPPTVCVPLAGLPAPQRPRTAGPDLPRDSARSRTSPGGPGRAPPSSLLFRSLPAT